MRAFRPVFLALGGAFQQAEYQGLGGTKPRNKKHISANTISLTSINHQSIKSDQIKSINPSNPIQSNPVQSGLVQSNPSINQEINQQTLSYRFLTPNPPLR